MAERIFHTDGACSGNPGRGGWAVICPDGTCISEGYLETTNNRMELMAAIRAMELAGNGDAVIVSDSQYVVKGHDEWLAGWIRSGWKRGTVKNRDLWERVAALKRPGIVFRWVRGHVGIAGNERADTAAVAAMRGDLKRDDGYPG